MVGKRSSLNEQQKNDVDYQYRTVWIWSIGLSSSAVNTVFETEQRTATDETCEKGIAMMLKRLLNHFQMTSLLVESYNCKECCVRYLRWPKWIQKSTKKARKKMKIKVVKIRLFQWIKILHPERSWIIWSHQWHKRCICTSEIKQ